MLLNIMFVRFIHIMDVVIDHLWTSLAAWSVNNPPAM